jgi:hypothetical protein
MREGWWWWSKFKCGKSKTVPAYDADVWRSGTRLDKIR